MGGGRGRRCRVVGVVGAMLGWRVCGCVHAVSVSSVGTQAAPQRARCSPGSKIPLSHSLSSHQCPYILLFFSSPLFPPFPLPLLLSITPLRPLIPLPPQRGINNHKPPIIHHFEFILPRLFAPREDGQDEQQRREEVDGSPGEHGEVSDRPSVGTGRI